MKSTKNNITKRILEQKYEKPNIIINGDFNS